MQSPAGYEISDEGNWEYASSEDPSKLPYNRLKGTDLWIPVDPSKKYALILVRENQPDLEPDLWSLFVTRSRGVNGSVYRVRGNVVDMYHEHAQDVNALDTELFKDAHTIAMLTEEEAQAVDHFAGLVPPPSAPGRASPTENCQGWIARLLERLSKEKVLTGQQLETIRTIVDPVR